MTSAPHSARIPAAAGAVTQAPSSTTLRDASDGRRERCPPAVVCWRREPERRYWGSCSPSSVRRAAGYSSCGPVPVLVAVESADELLEQAAQLRRLLQGGAQAGEGVFTVDHHRAALEAAVQGVVAEADAVRAVVALVGQQLDGGLGVGAGVGRLLDDLAPAPVELEGARDHPPPPGRRRPAFRCRLRLCRLGHRCSFGFADVAGQPRFYTASAPQRG